MNAILTASSFVNICQGSYENIGQNVLLCFVRVLVTSEFSCVDVINSLSLDGNLEIKEQSYRLKKHS